MARPKEFSEDMRARFPLGTFARIAKELYVGESRTEFVRDAVEEKILSRRKERKK